LSRSLLGFLMFCLLLVLVSAGVVWYVGPPLAAIVVDDERRAGPYYLLQLLPAGAASPGEGAPSYRSRFVTLASEDEGRLLWQGGAVDVLEGSVLLDVAAVQLMEFVTGADLVQILTSSDFRSLAADFSHLPLEHLGSSRPPVDVDADAATVVVLYRVDGEDAAAALGVPGERGWLALLPDFRGRVQWDAPVAQIRGSGAWNRVLLAQFPDTVLAQGWLEDPRTATERAIARKGVYDMVVLLVQPSGFGPR